ncbi:glycosyltransferase family 2 protein [candidate division WOR-3 bacterium]|nr:glycosyltransferase family 2 protein [candidate division WOR-3 bacterium]
MALDLTISIVHHKNRKFLEQCLDSIFKETKDIDFEIFVVNNCLNNGILELIREKYPIIKLIQNEKPEGFAKNHNKVLRQANGKYALVLNDDTVILDNAFDKLVKFMENNSKVGAVGCKMYSTDELTPPQVGCYRKFPTPFRLFCHTFMGVAGLRRIFPSSHFLREIGLGESEPNKECDAAEVSGCCMMVRKEVIKDIGYLDESFYMYLEDTDWYYRMNKADWRIHYYPKASIIHYGSGSLGFHSMKREQLYQQSINHFFMKHYGKKSVFLYLCFSALLFPISGIHKLYLKWKK